MQSPFPASYSTLAPLSLAELITSSYSLGQASCRFLVRGVGDTYLVEAGEAKYILRIYRSTHRSFSQIKEEVEVLIAAKKAGVAVAGPINDQSGVYIQALPAIEGIRHAVLFDYAPGNSVRVPDAAQLAIFGREMARLHEVTSGLGRNTDRWVFDPTTTLFTPLKRLANYYSELPDAYAWLGQAAAQVAERLGAVNSSGFAAGYCHFDFLPKNFHFDGDRITFFDFDFMGYGWLVNDLMSFWQHLQLEVYAGRLQRDEADDMFPRFVSAYREVRPVSEEELSLIPYLSLGFWLFYMGFHTTHDVFYPAIQPATLKAYTGFLQSLAREYWD